MPGSNEIAEFGEEQANTENLQIVTLKVSEKDIFKLPKLYCLFARYSS